MSAPGLNLNLLTVYLKTAVFICTCSQSFWISCFHDKRLGLAGCV